MMKSVQYFDDISFLLNKEVDNYVRELAIQGSSKVMQKVDSDFTLLHSLRYGYDDLSIMNTADKVKLLNEMKEKTTFTNLGYVNANGVGIDSDGVAVNIADQEVFKKAKRGIQNFGEFVGFDKNRYDKNLIFAVPVYKNNIIIGVFLWKIKMLC